MYIRVRHNFKNYNMHACTILEKSSDILISPFNLYDVVCVFARMCVRVAVSACARTRVFVCVYVYVHVRVHVRACVGRACVGMLFFVCLGCVRMWVCLIHIDNTDMYERVFRCFLCFLNCVWMCMCM